MVRIFPQSDLFLCSIVQRLMLVRLFSRVGGDARQSDEEVLLGHCGWIWHPSVNLKPLRSLA